MKAEFTIQELLITVSTDSKIHSALNLDFLRSSGIIPIDWEIDEKPIYTPHLSQISFKNGITISSQLHQIYFLEKIEGKSFENIITPSLAANFVKSLPSARYQKLSIEPKGHTSFDGENDQVHQYITKTLLSPGSWYEFGKSPMLATITFSYSLENGVFNLTVREAALRLPDENVRLVVLFSGNFEFVIMDDSNNKSHEKISLLLNECKDNLIDYRDLVTTKFLSVEL